jgi:hypothetical protein
LSLREEFEEFHEANPEVYRLLLKMTRQAVAAGHRKFGMQRLIEVIRWDYMIGTTSTDYKINNNYAAFYARRIMKHNPSLAGVFEIRTSYADNEK